MVAHFNALTEVAALPNGDIGGEIAFIQFRDELATQTAEDKERRYHQYQRAADGDAPMMQEPAQLRSVPVLQAMDHAFAPALTFRDLFPHENGDSPRHVGEAQDQGADDRKAHGKGHGAEHLALHADQRENGDVDDKDDHLPEHRALHDAACATDRLIVHVLSGYALARVALVQGEHHAFHHDHRAVHDQTEVQRAHAHQVGALPGQYHAANGEEQCERDHTGHDEARAPVAQQQHQHRDHDQRAHQQVVLHGADGLVHQFRAVDESIDVYAFRQAVLDLLHPFLHGGDCGHGVGALQHQHHAAHGLALAVARHRAVAHRMPKAHFGHIAHAHRTAAARADHDVLHVLQRGDHAFATDEIDVRSFFDVAATGVGVVVLQGVEHVHQREPCTGQAARIHAHLVLFQQAAEAAHIDHPGYAQQVFAHHPILQRTQFQQVVLVLMSAVHGEGVLEDLTRTGGGRGDLRCTVTGRDLRLHLRDALRDQLPREVERYLVLEHHGDHREAAARNTAQLHHVGQVLEGLLQREGDELLHLLRGEVGRDGVHQHLVVGDVRQRVDGQLRYGPGAPADEGQKQQADDELVADAECDDAIDHAMDLILLRMNFGDRPVQGIRSVEPLARLDAITWKMHGAKPHRAGRKAALCPLWRVPNIPGKRAQCHRNIRAGQDLYSRVQ